MADDAATMRRAAALMRDRAEAIPHGPWHWQALGEHGYPQRVVNEGAYLIAECFTGPDARLVEAEYIASMHPGVAAAVADWLDDEAERAERPGALAHHSLSPGPLAVARAYLGETT